MSVSVAGIQKNRCRTTVQRTVRPAVVPPMPFDFQPLTNFRLARGSHKQPNKDGNICVNEAAVPGSRMTNGMRNLLRTLCNITSFR